MQFYQVMQSEIVEEKMLSYDLNIIRKRIIEGLDLSFSHPDAFLKYKWIKEQYDDLIINVENAKLPIYDVNHVDNNHNVHFYPVDEFRNKE